MDMINIYCIHLRNQRGVGDLAQWPSKRKALGSVPSSEKKKKKKERKKERKEKKKRNCQRTPGG